MGHLFHRPLSLPLPPWHAPLQCLRRIVFYPYLRLCAFAPLREIHGIASSIRECKMSHNEITKTIIEVAIDIHRKLGPGLLESVYLVVLAHELRKRGLRVEKEV